MVGVEEGKVSVKDKDGNVSTIEAGTCVWATGVAPHPLVSNFFWGEEMEPGERWSAVCVTVGASPPRAPPPPLCTQVIDLMDQLPHPEAQTARGRALLVDEHLVVRGSGGRIFALGDAATNADDPASALPATAQVARQQGEYLAGLLNSHR